ncbi:hypothetical protein AALA99_13605 [Anaerotruncus colihominis]|uniref:hypothetical protein n=1 Tax=Anaerotruncus colihominis TaxID=169435 RepID=UPI003512E1DB
MTNQEKKEFLRRYHTADCKLTALFDELAGWRSRAVKITPSLSGMPGGSTEDSLQIAIKRIADLEQEIAHEIVHLIQIRTEITETIGIVRNEKLRLLLEYRYIYGDTWARIADRMGYSRRQITRLHGLALSRLEIKVSFNVPFFFDIIKEKAHPTIL